MPAESGEPSPVPSAHVGMSPSRFEFNLQSPPREPPSPRTTINRIQVPSFTPRNPNRLSLSLPIVTGTVEIPRAPTSTANTPSFPPTPIDSAVESPSEPTDLLVAVASQERKVLELKEELYKAERALAKLKVQWQRHERKRKTAEIQRLEPLQPLQTVVTDNGRSNTDADGKRRSMEIEKRKSLILKAPTREFRRKQFSGNHTRALSLLSPERSNFPRQFPTVTEAIAMSEPLGLPIPRSTSSTLPGTNQDTIRPSNARNRHSYQSGIHGAKQIADDLKTGMWTFLEDLRQATIGDEMTSGNPNRLGLDLAHNVPKKKGSRGSLRGHKNRHSYSPGGTALPRTWDTLTGLGISDVAEPLFSRPPSRGPSKSPIGTLKKKPSKRLSFTPLSVDTDDDWSSWDATPIKETKSPRWSGSTDLSGPATPSHRDDDETIK